MSKLIIVTALMSEAVPLIDYYRMLKQPGRAHYQLFRSKQLELLVCGVGAERMRRGMRAYLEHEANISRSIWLNLGIAGGYDQDIGQLVWADCVGNTRISLPAGINNVPTITVCSQLSPSRNYRAGVLLDMEADSWLHSIAENPIEFEPERLFCAKVVSDNRCNNGHIIDKKWVCDIMRQQIKELDYQINILINT
jgi:nucleoside phosphorylase